ncbi:MAG: phosphoadenylyl-sulfate reductase [Balneolaceae bacterium]|nr:phosphoadenylyl-sulfate reductase [Balneolaceae bacterium]
MQSITKPITFVQQNLTQPLLDNLNQQFEEASPDRVLAWGYQTFGSEMVLGTGFGPSGVYLIDRLHRNSLDIPIFYLDTQLFFEETYELRDTLEERYDIAITRVSPEFSVKEQAERYGDEMWKHNPNRCCYLRKVRPLRNYLSDKKAWVTGVRRSQSETRKKTRVVEWDPENRVVKINPLARWSGDEVWEYIHSRGLPYNPLHDEGYPSIGCIPCTRPVGNDDTEERAGRWNGTDKTECGIHLPTQNLESRKTGS